MHSAGLGLVDERRGLYAIAWCYDTRWVRCCPNIVLNIFNEEWLNMSIIKWISVLFMMVHHYSLTSVLLSSAIGKIAFVHMIPFFAWAISSFLRFLIFPSLILIRFFVYLSVCRWHFFVSSFICFFVSRRSPAHPRHLNHSMLFCFFVFLSGEPLRWHRVPSGIVNTYVLIVPWKTSMQFMCF